MKKISIIFFINACLLSTSSWAVDECTGQTILKSSACAGDGIEAEELKLHKLVNEYRAEKGLPAIALSPALSVVANRHVQDLDKNLKKLDHGWSDCAYKPRDQSTFNCMWKAPQRLGTSYKGNGYENAAFSSDMNAVNALAMWKKSSAHNNVILNQSIWKQLKWKSLGIGIYNGYAVLWFGDLIDSSPKLEEKPIQVKQPIKENIEDKATDPSPKSEKPIKVTQPTSENTEDKVTDPSPKSEEPIKVTQPTSENTEDKATSSSPKSEEPIEVKQPTGESVEDRIIELYSAYFNRAADKKGFSFWKKSFNRYYSEGDNIKLIAEKESNALQKITNDMANADEYKALYPETQSSVNFIKDIYTNLLGRRTDSAGLAFWANHLDGKRMTRGHAILNIIAGAKANKTSQGIKDSGLISNKTNVSKYFSKTLGLNDLKLAKSAFSGITDASNTVKTAKANLDLASKSIKNLNTEQQAVLDYHNKVRADVNVQKLTWSTEAAEHAQTWANNLASNSCGFEHSKDSGYGENIFKGTQGAFDMVDAAKSWEDEKQLYKGGAINNDNFKAVGHYTQMVWSRTTGVGCATSTCNNQITVVCNYTPQGNILGEKPF